ncbi:sugar ABC transporter substrate-binding protein, partial [Vibrio anguillarum]
MSKNSFKALLLCCALLLSGLSFAEETVRIGDLVQVDLPGEPSFNNGFQVDKRGRITLPEVGPLYVAGYDEIQLQRAVSDALSRVFRDISTLQVFIAEQQLLISVQGYV